MPLNEAHAPGETITAADINALAAAVNDLAAGTATPVIRKAERSSTDVALTSTTFIAVDTALDLTIPAVAGDVIEFGLSVSASHSVANGLVALDVGSIVSSAVVNRIGNANDGVSAWRSQRSGVGDISQIGGSYLYTVVSGDLAAGSMLARLLAKTNTGTLSLRSDSPSRRLQFWAHNHGTP